MKKNTNPHKSTVMLVFIAAVIIVLLFISILVSVIKKDMTEEIPVKEIYVIESMDDSTGYGIREESGMLFMETVSVENIDTDEDIEAFKTLHEEAKPEEMESESSVPYLSETSVPELKEPEMVEPTPDSESPVVIEPVPEVPEPVQPTPEPNKECNHSFIFDSYYQEPTCSSGGLENQVCMHCGMSQTTPGTPTGEHHFVTETEGDCCSEEVVICKDCNYRETWSKNSGNHIDVEDGFCYGCGTKLH